MNGNFLIAYSDFSSGVNQVGLFNPQSDVMTNANYLDVSSVHALYGVTYHPGLDRIFVSDANDFVTTGYVLEYTGDGTYLQSYHVGLNPSKIVFYD